jgi:hypothetical protein
MKLSRVLALCALVVVGGGCDSILGGDSDEVSFQSVRINYTQGTQEEAVAVGVIGTLQIDGIFVMPHPCHELRANMNRVAANIEVSVVAEQTNTTCTAEVSAMQYRVQSFGLNRGVYRVSVYHQIRGQARRLISQTDVAVG